MDGTWIFHPKQYTFVQIGVVWFQELAIFYNFIHCESTNILPKYSLEKKSSLFSEKSLEKKILMQPSFYTLRFVKRRDMDVSDELLDMA